MLYVNGVAIAAEKIEEEMERMRPEYERTFAEMDEDQREAQLHEWARENVIEREVLLQAAQAVDPLVTDSEVREQFDTLLNNHGGRDEYFKQIEGGEDREPEILSDIKRGMHMDRFLQKVTALENELAEEDVRAYFVEHADEFVHPEMIHACHIVKHIQGQVASKEIQDEMETILSKLRGGADFAEMCYEHSDCPQNGGDLGTFPRGEMVEEFEEMVFSLPVGGISNVFQTRFGLHIAKVIERIDPKPADFNEVKEQLAQQLTHEKGHDQLMDYLDSLKEKAVIEDRDE